MTESFLGDHTDYSGLDAPMFNAAAVSAIEYTVTAGFNPDDVPDLIAVALQVSRRAASAPAGTVRSQSVNGASVSYAFSGSGATSIQLLQDEREILDRYRIARLP